METPDNELQRCDECRKTFPAELFASSVCPLCALANRNRTHGLPEDTPFHGETAQWLWEQALEFERKRK